MQPDPVWELSQVVIGACIEVHRIVGPGLLEAVYEACLAHELGLRGLTFDQQVPVPVRYKGADFKDGYRLDFLVEKQLILELKAVDRLLPVHEAQVITYLRLTRAPVALLINFHAPVLRNGLRRLTFTP
jgi:GxxExxY protein